MVENSKRWCPHFILEPGVASGRIQNYQYPKCDFIHDKGTIKKEHRNKYCWNEYQKCIDEKKYEEWWECISM
jgi:hypothetical protein